MLWDGEAPPASQPLPQALPETQTSEKGIIPRPGSYRGTLDPASSPLPRDPVYSQLSPSHSMGPSCPFRGNPLSPQPSSATAYPEHRPPNDRVKCPHGTACLSRLVSGLRSSFCLSAGAEWEDSYSR